MIKTIPNCSVNYAIACFSQGDLYVLPVFVKRRELPGTWIPLPSYPQALQSSLQEQQKGLTYLSTAVEELSRKGPAEVSQSYRSELDVVLGRWKKLSAQLAEQCQKLEERMTRLQRFQVHHNFYASANSRRLVSLWLRQNTFRCLQELLQSEISKHDKKMCLNFCSMLMSTDFTLNSDFVVLFDYVVSLAKSSNLIKNWK